MANGLQSWIDVLKHEKPIQVTVIPMWERLLLGFLGPGLTLATPILNKISSVQAKNQETISTFVSSGVVVLVIIWIISFILTIRNDDTNGFKCFLTSVGLPGFIISVAPSVLPNFGQ